MKTPTRYLFLFVLPVFCSLLFWGCAPNSAYRTRLDLCTSANPEKDCATNSLQEYRHPTDSASEYTLGFVEYDDQGILRSRSQMDTLLHFLQGKSHDENYLMVVFAHGWRHNASNEDGNVQTLRETLMGLSRLETAAARVAGKKKRRIMGIYLGWRGKSADLEPFTTFSFWSRKNTAHRVGYGGVAELLVNLESIRNIDERLDEKKESFPGKLVVVGHSFGGALIYSALSQIVIDRFVDVDGITGSPRSFGDLVVLINPAFEAGKFTTLRDMAGSRRYFNGQKPVLTVLTSQGDNATKVAFPIGRWFSTLFSSTVSREQKKSIRTAIGHYKPYRTHILEWDEWQDSSAAEGKGNRGEDLARTLGGMQKDWETGGMGKDMSYPGSKLVHTGPSDPLNPYMVASVDNRIIQGHNGINDRRLVEFLRYFILFSTHGGSADTSAFPGLK